VIAVNITNILFAIAELIERPGRDGRQSYYRTLIFSDFTHLLPGFTGEKILLYGLGDIFSEHLVPVGKTVPGPVEQAVFLNKQYSCKAGQTFNP
jgi:hypothetical protein